MNKIYVLVPVALLAVFSIFYVSYLKESGQKAEMKRQQVEKQKEEDAEKKRLAEDRARQDAEKRTRDREAEDAKKEADKQAKYQADIDKIKKETAGYQGEADKYAQQSANLDKELKELRTNKDRLINEEFDLEKKVELAKIDRRNAELEIQRYTEMVAKKAADSSMAKIPPPVNVATNGK